MYADFEDWVDYTTTKEKEQHLLSYLEDKGVIDNDGKRVVDECLFDDNNIPYAFPSIEEVFVALDIDEDDFIEFVSNIN